MGIGYGDLSIVHNIRILNDGNIINAYIHRNYTQLY